MPWQSNQYHLGNIKIHRGEIQKFTKEYRRVRNLGLTELHNIHCGDGKSKPSECDFTGHILPEKLSGINSVGAHRQAVTKFNTSGYYAEN